MTVVKLLQNVFFSVVQFGTGVSQGQKFPTKCKNLESPSGILQEFMDCHHKTFDIKLKYPESLREWILAKFLTLLRGEENALLFSP